MRSREEKEGTKKSGRVGREDRADCVGETAEKAWAERGRDAAFIRAKSLIKTKRKSGRKVKTFG